MPSLQLMSKTPLAMMIGGMLLATGQTVISADSASSLIPEVLIKFTGIDETSAYWGVEPLFPPLPGNDGLLHGSIRQSGATRGRATVGLTYSYNPASGAYHAVSMGELGSVQSPLLKDEATGTLYGSVFISNIEASRWVTKGLIYTQDADGAHQHALAPSSSYYLGGQMALDDANNLYIPVGMTTNACTEGNANALNNLYRVTPVGAFERVLNFCHFSEGGTTAATQHHPYGSGALAYLWSKEEEALYVLMSVLTTSLTEEGVRPTATLLRIPKATLDQGANNEGIVAASDFERLHFFSQGKGGLPQVGMVQNPEVTSTLLEDGDWIYGTSVYDGYGGNSGNQAVGNGSVWRINKTTKEFQVVHQFRAGAEDGSSDPADGTENADGYQPSGPLALAADGNIYGTTLSDASTLSSGNPFGAGALFRIKVGTAADRADDQLEILYRLDAYKEGMFPTGFSAGIPANGTQALYGVTRIGNDDRDDVDNDGPIYGALFSLSVPLPGSGSLALAATGATEVAAGEAVSLDWSNPWHTQGCVLNLASGSDSLLDLNPDGQHDLAELLARQSLPAGISLTGDLATGRLSFPLQATASYQLVCEEPFADYQGELESSEVAFTLKAAGGGSGGSSGSGFNPLLLLPLGLLTLLRLRRRR